MKSIFHLTFRAETPYIALAPRATTARLKSINISTHRQSFSLSISMSPARLPSETINQGMWLVRRALWERDQRGTLHQLRTVCRQWRDADFWDGLSNTERALNLAEMDWCETMDLTAAQWKAFR
jgi:hypothetical protein